MKTAIIKGRGYSFQVSQKVEPGVVLSDEAFDDFVKQLQEQASQEQYPRIQRERPSEGSWSSSIIFSKHQSDTPKV